MAHHLDLFLSDLVSPETPETPLTPASTDVVVSTPETDDTVSREDYLSKSPRERLLWGVDVLVEGIERRHNRYSRQVQVLSSRSSWRAYFETKGALTALRRLQIDLRHELRQWSREPSLEDLLDLLRQFDPLDLVGEEYASCSLLEVERLHRWLLEWVAEGLSWEERTTPRWVF